MSNDKIAQDDMRSRAVLRLKKKAEFRTHLFVYIVVNVALIVMWWVTGASFFWPVFSLLGWGIGVIFHAQDAYGRHEVSEDAIQREIERMR